MQLNAEDKGTRKFIMVQLPEPCNEKSEAWKAGYTTIAEISKERIRRAGTKIKEEGENKKEDKEEIAKKSPSPLPLSSLLREEPGKYASLNLHSPSLDIGFRVLKIDSTNMEDVYYAPDSIEQKQLKLFTDNIKPGRTAEDLLFQVLLDWGVDLSYSIKRDQIDGKEIFIVADGALIACFDNHGGINEEFVKKLAKRKPVRVVFRDAGFKEDSVKINVGQIFKLMSPGTEVRTI